MNIKKNCSQARCHKIIPKTLNEIKTESKYACNEGHHHMLTLTHGDALYYKIKHHCIICWNVHQNELSPHCLKGQLWPQYTHAYLQEAYVTRGNMSQESLHGMTVGSA